MPEATNVEGHPASKGDVRIGNDVWIGMGALILSGVTIGDGVVIAARAVVSRDVPPYAIAAGNPARVVRMRFPDDVIRELLRLRWWDWDVERVRRYIPLLMQPDISAFQGLRRRGPDRGSRQSAQPRAASVSTSPRDLYLDLLIKILANTVYGDPAMSVYMAPWVTPDNMVEYRTQYRQSGLDWPMVAHTMVGLRRLENLRDLAQRAIDTNIPGDFIEAGVWRGGCCILMRGVLKANGVTDRKV